MHILFILRFSRKKLNDVKENWMEIQSKMFALLAEQNSLSLDSMFNNIATMISFNEGTQ